MTVERHGWWLRAPAKTRVLGGGRKSEGEAADSSLAGALPQRISPWRSPTCANAWLRIDLSSWRRSLRRRSNINESLPTLLQVAPDPATIFNLETGCISMFSPVRKYQDLATLNRKTPADGVSVMMNRPEIIIHGMDAKIASRMG